MNKRNFAKLNKKETEVSKGSNVCPNCNKLSGKSGFFRINNKLFCNKCFEGE